MDAVKYEKQLIAGMIQNPDLVGRVRRAKIGPEHVADKKCSYLLNMMLVMHSEKSEIIPDTLKDLIRRDHELEVNLKNVYQSYVDNLAATDVDSVNFSINTLEKKRRDVELHSLLDLATEEFIHSKDSQAVIDAMKSRLSVIEVSNDYLLTEYSTTAAYQLRQAERVAVSSDLAGGLKMTGALEFLSTNIPRGFSKGSTTAIGGNTGVGKSMFLANVAAEAVNQGMTVLYIMAENAKLLDESRMDAILLGLQYDSLYLPSETRGATAKKYFSELKGRMFTVKFRVNHFDANSIRSVIEDMIDQGVTPDILFVDSPDHMDSVVKMFRTHERKEQVYLEIKDLTDEYEIPAVTTLPMKAGASKMKKVGAEEAGGAYAISKIVNNAIFFYKNAEDELIGRRQIEVVKARDGITDGKKIALKIRKDLKFVPWEEAVSAAQDANPYMKIRKFKDGKKDADSEE